MAGLPKQILPINLGQGIDTKTDPKAVIPGKLTTLENAEFKKIGRIDKRDGGTALDNVSLTGGKSLIAFKDQLLQIKNNQLYAYSEESDEWVSKGYVSNCEVQTTQISYDHEASTAGTGETQIGFDAVEHNGIIVFAKDGELGAIDAKTGSKIVSLDPGNEGFGSRICGMKCLAWGDYVYVFYNNSSSEAAVRRINTTSPTDGFSSESTYKATRLDSFDVIVHETYGILVASETIGNITTTWLNADMSTQTSPRAPKAWAGDLGSDNLNVCVVEGPDDEFYIGFSDTSGTGSTYHSYAVIDHEQTLVLTKTSIGTNDTTVPFSAITGYNTGSGVKFFFSEGTPHTNTEILFLKTATVNNAGVTSAAATLCKGLLPASSVFTYADKRYFLAGLTTDSEVKANNCYFLIDADSGQVVSKHLFGATLGRNAAGTLYSVSNPSTGVFKIPMVGLANADSEIYSYHIAKIDFNYHVQAKALGDHLILAGGFVSMYDGESVSELNFHHFPEILSASSASTGGSISDGTYQYKAVYEWIDVHGVLHQSAASLVESETISSGTSTNTITVVVMSYRVTQKEDVRITLYRTEAGGDVFYRTAETYRQTGENDTDTFQVSIDDTTSDADLISNPILYTEGDILDNEAPPAAGRIAVFNNRIWLGRLETSDQLWFSHEKRKGYPPRFSSTLVKAVESASGEMEAFGVLGDKLFVYEKNRYQFTYGEGPNEQGFGGSFALFQTIPTATGCKDPKSMVETPLGLMFKSSKGIYLTDTSLQSQYVGAPVEDFNDETITSAILMPGKDQIRFTTEDGNMLVYDYYQDKWGTFTNRDAYDAAVWKGDTYVVLRKTAGDVIQEAVGTYQDAGTDYTMTLETGWISLANIVGLQRVRRLFISGERKSSHTLKVSVAYDYSDSYEDEVTLAPDTALEDGATGFYPYRFNIHLKKQKCQAIRFKFEELTPSGTSQGLNISSIGLEVAMKQGFAKLRATQKAGTA